MPYDSADFRNFFALLLQIWYNIKSYTMIYPDMVLAWYRWLLVKREMVLARLKSHFSLCSGAVWVIDTVFLVPVRIASYMVQYQILHNDLSWHGARMILLTIDEARNGISAVEIAFFVV